MAQHEFEDIGAFVEHIATRELTLHAAMRAGLEHALVVIEKKAKDEIGHYQPEVGNFPAWAPLTAATEAEKARIGAPADAPLLRHGGLYASFEHEVVSHDEGIVGSTAPTLIFHELGTEKMPPRPVLGPAVVSSHDEIVRILGHAVVEGIMGGQVMEHAAEYFGGHIEAKP